MPRDVRACDHYFDPGHGFRVMCGATSVLFYKVAPNDRTERFDAWCFGRCPGHKLTRDDLRDNHHTREISEAEAAVFEVHSS